MSPREQLTAFWTILRKEVVRFLRIWTQTVLPPAITMGIYFVVFGSFLGTRIQDIEGFSYIQFIVPGLVMMSTITSSFSNVASSFFSAKFQRSVEEMLVSPVPNWILLTAYVIGGAARGIVVGLVVLGVSLFFTRLHLHSLAMVLVFLFLTALLFAIAGFTNGVLARKFDDVFIVPTFVLTPLTYFGGVFYSIDLLPPLWQKVSVFNPILYMVNGLRYGFLAVTDVPVANGIAILAVCSVVLFAVNIVLLRRGYGLKT
ncbi:MAG: ABC transporter permease [Armatimonadetes bacterium]|nr:ABC transporter permease [Armatimonadota bacterium]